MINQLLIRHFKFLLVLFASIILISIPLVSTAVTVDSNTKTTIEISKDKLLPLESFTTTVRNVPSNGPTMLILTPLNPRKDKGVFNTAIVYRFQGNDRSVIHLCAPREAGLYRLSLVKDYTPPDEHPVTLTQGPVFEVTDVQPSQKEKDMRSIDCYDLISRPGLTDFGDIQLYHDGKTVKGFATWNNIQLAGKVKRLVKGQFICVSLQWVSYTKEGKADRKGDILIYISPDGEGMNGRYRIENSDYWRCMRSQWTWDLSRLQEKRPVVFFRENSGIRLLWNRNLLKGEPQGYNIYLADSKGRIKGNPINKKPVTDTSYLLNSPDLSKSYVIAALNKNGKAIYTEAVTGLDELDNYIINLNGHDIFYSYYTAMKNFNNRKSKVLLVDPFYYVNSLDEVYKYLYWEKFPGKYDEEPNAFSAVTSSKGDSLTLKFREKTLIIKKGSAYYWSNGVKKSWGGILKTKKDKDGIDYFEVPFYVVNEALGLKPVIPSKSNLINITLEIK